MICPVVNEYAESRTFLHTQAGITEIFTKGGLLLVITPKFSSANANWNWPPASFAVVECSASPSPCLGAFLLSCSLHFYISISPCFRGTHLGRNPHSLCLRALWFLICLGLFAIGKRLCCDRRVHDALSTKPLAHRDPAAVQAHQSEWMGTMVSAVGGQGKPHDLLIAFCHCWYMLSSCSTPSVLKQWGNDPPKDITVFPLRSICGYLGTILWCQHHPSPQEFWFDGVWDQKRRAGWASATGSLLQQRCKEHLLVWPKGATWDPAVHLQRLGGAALDSASQHFTLGIGQHC